MSAGTILTIPKTSSAQAFQDFWICSKGDYLLRVFIMYNGIIMLNELFIEKNKNEIKTIAIAL